MKKVILKASKRVYIVFGIMLGWIPIAIATLAYERCTIARDLPFILVTSVIFLSMYVAFSVYKITYNNKQIIYKGLFGTKIVDIKEIKNYNIKVALDTISTKPIFGLFKITINDPRRPTFGLVIDTIDKKSNIVIPVRLFKKEDIDNLIKHIESENTNFE